MRKITEEEFDRVVFKEKERQKFREQYRSPKDTSVESNTYRAVFLSTRLPTSQRSQNRGCGSKRSHTGCLHQGFADNAAGVLKPRILSNISEGFSDNHSLSSFSSDFQGTIVECLGAPTSEGHMLINPLREDSQTIPNSIRASSVQCSVGVLASRHLKRSKTLHKVKNSSLMLKKLVKKDGYCDNTSSTLSVAKAFKGPLSTSRLSPTTAPTSSIAFQSAKPTAYSVTQQKQEVNNKTQCSCNALNCCHKSHQYQQYVNHQQTTITNDIFQSIPPKLSNVLTTEDDVFVQKQRHNQNSFSYCCDQEGSLSPTVNTRKRLKTRKRCNCLCSAGSNLINSFSRVRCVRLFQKISTLSQEIFSSTTPATWSTTPTRFRHYNLSNVFLILIMLISLAPIVCGHNVNLNNSDKIAPTKQQHIHQQFHHHDQHEGAGSSNNIRRELNSRFSNFGSSFTSTDDTVLSDGEIGESSRRFVGEDSLGMSTIGNSDRADSGAGSTTFVRSGCHSCQMREKVKADNLASIKRHILYRLKLKDVPNITAPVVPPEIVEKFYKSHYQNGGANGGSGGNGGSAGDRGRSRSGSGNGAGGSHSRNRYSDENAGGGGSGARYSSTFYDNMQGDDPRAYYDTNYDGSDTSDNFGNGQYTGFGDDSAGGGDDEDYEEDFFSIVNSIYVFPTTQHPRHNRKTDILHFPLSNNGHSTVSQATLHVFLRSWSWVRENFDSTLTGHASAGTSSPSPSSSSSSSSSQSHQQHGPNSMPPNAVNRNLDVILKINSVLRHANITNSQKGSELRHRIPRSDNGIWITVDVTDMVTEWYNNVSSNHGVVIKTKESWMKQFVVLDDSMANKTYAPYIEVMTKDNRKRRSKRNTSLNCSESDNEIRCCRYPLEVNFRHFNWEWIIAPQSFNAYFCNGECKLGFLPKYPHTHLMQMSTAPQPCCSPTKMSPVSLLYFNTEHILVMSTIPNMAVDKCSCS